jgi:hypothetical protein
MILRPVDPAHATAATAAPLCLDHTEARRPNGQCLPHDISRAVHLATGGARTRARLKACDQTKAQPAGEPREDHPRRSPWPLHAPLDSRVKPSRFAGVSSGHSPQRGANLDSRARRHRLDSPAARTVLTAASTPAAAAALTVDELASLLRAAGRQRGIAAEAAKLHTHLGSKQMRQSAAVQDAMGLQLLGLVGQLDAVCRTLEQLEQRIDEMFTAHPDAKIVTSVPGLGSSWARGCWRRSATTGAGSPTRGRSGRSPVRPQ